jgi:spermidine/putrescine-binding protein
MTDEVFSWNAASNNQGLIAGKLSYILNSISAWRTAQGANPEVADDIHFVPALRGPKDARAAQHVLYNWIIPKHATNIDAAKEFLLHYTANFSSATWNSKLYDFPAWAERVPQLDGWLKSDPYGAKPADKLAFLADATQWSTNIGYPGPSNTAIGEVFGTFVIPTMFARAARGELSPKQAVAQADAQIKPIFEKWRARGLVGGQ